MQNVRYTTLQKIIGRHIKKNSLLSTQEIFLVTIITFPSLSYHSMFSKPCSYVLTRVSLEKRLYYNRLVKVLYTTICKPTHHIYAIFSLRPSCLHRYFFTDPLVWFHIIVNIISSYLLASYELYLTNFRNL